MQKNDVQFDWDIDNVRHLARHRVTPAEAEQAILDENAILLEIESTHGEERTKVLSMTPSGRLLVVIFTFRRGDAIRPVTAYSAPKRLRKCYLEGRRVG
jgi:uncharacterized DUF497 family protein